VHVHTNDPGLAIQKALKYGALSNMKIDNMRLEHQEKLFKMSAGKSAPAAEMEAAGVKKADESEGASGQPPKEFGFIAVSVGEGMNEIFKSLGVDYIIEGGQTMNPSTADILDAVDKVNAKTIFVLPNNKNIILAANQAAELTAEKDLFVIPTKTIPQGITAVINFVPELGADENEANMIREIKNVCSGEVTYAVRDTVIDDKEIRKGDYMGIGDAGIIAVGTDISGVAKDTIAGMMTEDAELISIYYGSDVKGEEAEAFSALVAESYPDCDIELQYGGQPIYYYVISVE
ncbi:MAG: DAK2 domain-containing protein, partial [Lachnospiraceae bacterium]|nr:DAK2 domain-containing protein [Lachnospiraceae bacterium]